MLGEELVSAALTERGIVGDRAYALVDRVTGHVVSAKNPRKWPTMFAARARFVEPPREGCPLPAVRIQLPEGEQVDSDRNDIDAILTDTFGRDVSLRSSISSEGRHQFEMSDAENVEKVDTVDTPAGSFFDLSVLHLLTTATLARLGQLYPGGRFAVTRFRPNLVLATDATGFVENDWVGRTLRIGDTVRLRITEPCSRCIMTTLAQGELPRDPEILRTATRHNQGNVGVHAAILQGGTVRQGDVCELE
jgi:uncharacterized protein YcbX